MRSITWIAHVGARGADDALVLETVALGPGAEETDHLRAAHVAALADIHVAAGELERGIGLQAVGRLEQAVLVEVRQDRDQPAEADDDESRFIAPALRARRCKARSRRS